MRKKIAMLFMMAGVMSMVSAKTVTSTYYGEKANDSIKNPCKGDLVRVCATIQTEIEEPAPAPTVPGIVTTGTKIVTTIFDADGNFVSSTAETSLKTASEIIDEYLNKIPENASIAISDDEIF